MSYHVIVRGNERKNIFRHESDFRKFIKIAESAKDKYQFVVHAYVLMSNHYHILVELKQSNFSRAMQYINTCYGIYFNRKYKRIGHLVQSKYKAIIVEHGPDLQYVAAYIHLNPARAGMVEKLIDYPWSSHRQFTGGVNGGLAEPERILRLFSEDRISAVEKYETYVKQTAIETNDEKKARMYGDYVMGSEGFVRNIKLMLKGRKLPDEIVKRRKLKKTYNPSDIIESTAEYFKINKNELMFKKGKWNRHKGVLMHLLDSDAGMTYSEIGRLLGDMSQASIGRICKKVAEESKYGKIKAEKQKIRKRYAA